MQADKYAYSSFPRKQTNNIYIYDYKLDIRWFCYFFYVNTIIYGKIIALEQYF